jgi:hypothetical protein
VISVQGIAVSIESLQIRRNHNPLKSPNLVFGQALRRALDEIREKSPEIIITVPDTLPEYSWLKRELSKMQPGFLGDYAVLAEEGGVQILRRKPSDGAPHESAAPEPARQASP